MRDITESFALNFSSLDDFVSSIYVCVFTCPSVRPSAHPSVHPCPTIYLSICLSKQVFCLSTCPTTTPSVCPSIHDIKLISSHVIYLLIVIFLAQKNPFVLLPPLSFQFGYCTSENILNTLPTLIQEQVRKPSETDSIMSQISSKIIPWEKGHLKRHHQRHHQRQPGEQQT